MKKLPVQFRCYVELDREVNQWVAVCIDLCLAAQASSCEEAKKLLHMQVLDYLQDAVEAPTFQQRKEMLNRKAPFSEIFKYYYIKISLMLNIDLKATRYKESPTPQYMV